MGMDATSSRHGDPTRPEVDWATAEVHDATLSVELTQPPPRGWQKRLTAVAAQLGQSNGSWGDIRAKKGRIVVSAVTQGAEDELRHVLESAVLETNGAEPEAGDEGAAGPDEQMTAAFRAFQPGAADDDGPAEP